MNNPLEPTQTKEQLDINSILATLRESLPRVASDLIKNSKEHDREDPEQQKLQLAFSLEPNSSTEHSPRWHQHGVLTHSEKFRRFLEVDAPILMEQWGLSDVTSKILSEEIDGTSKADLLQIAALVHDLGKFTSRTFDMQDDDTLLARFVDHEAHSGVIIRSSFNNTLKELGLSEKQIEYIAQCAEHHFELGKIRRVAVENGGYTMAFAQSEAFKKAAQNIIDENSELALEIGLMFIADSLSKTELSATPGTDEEIESQRAHLEEEIRNRGLNPLLINQALQQPVNMEIGKRFLELWAESRRAAAKS